MRKTGDCRLRKGVLWMVVAGCICAGLPTGAQSSLPVREITVFKDGHAFLLHAGRMPTNAAGDVTLSAVPNPILGAFWPYSADRNVPLNSVTAERAATSVKHAALNVRELLQANVGARITVVQSDKQTYEAEVVDVPERAPAPPSTPLADSTANYNNDNYGSGGFGGYRGVSTPSLPETALLKTERGTAAVPLALIQKITFHGAYHRELAQKEYRSRLTLHLAWPGGKAKAKADVGMMYLQKGVRWLPSYRIALDGKGHASVRFQATLLNEMVDLKDVTVHLVIGVPNFLFSDTPDPIALQQSFPALSRYFQGDSQTGFAFSNSLMSQQVGGFGGGGRGGNGQPEPAPGKLNEVNGDRNEDLYVFTVKHVTLPKGASMALPVTEFALNYRDLYRLELALTPPSQIENRSGLSAEQQQEIDRLQRMPKVEHRLRFTNSSHYPLTTAPALLVMNDRVIAQSLMAYTSVGADVDVTLTTAVDVHAKKSERETTRNPNAASWNRQNFTRLDMAGTIDLINYADRAIDMEVVRYLPGTVEKADDSRIEMVNMLDSDAEEGATRLPAWWAYYSWPYWWSHFNGLSRVSWNVKLAPRKAAHLEYSWHYYIE